MKYSDLSHANLQNCDMAEANLLQSVMHCTRDVGTNWKGTSRLLVETTDKDLAAAENWKPPRSSI